MLRLSVRSARTLGGRPSTALSSPRWPIAAGHRASVRSVKHFTSRNLLYRDSSKKPVIPPSETQSSERSPLPSDLGQTAPGSVQDIPLTPPTPDEASSDQSLGSRPQPTATIDDVGECSVLHDKTPAPGPPPPPQPRSFMRRLRRLVLALVFLGALGFGGGVWFSRVNDNFHDFFTEYVPFGERAVLYLEDMEFRKRFNQKTGQSIRHHLNSETTVKIPAQSGDSWRVADSGEPGGRHSSASPRVTDQPRLSPDEPGKTSTAKPSSPETDATPVKSAERVAPQGPKHPSAARADGSKAPKAPEVDEPSRFPPLEPIDLMSLPDAKEPIIKDLVHMLNDLIVVINADGAHGKYDSAINKAKGDVAKVGDKVRDMKNNIEKQAASEVRSSIREFDDAANELVKRVEHTILSQEMQGRQEFEQEMKKMREHYDQRVNLVVERERKLNEEKSKNQLLEQALALEKEFVREVENRIENERDGRLGRLKELSATVSELEKLMAGWNEVVDSNLKTQQLHVAVDAVRASLEDAQHPRPFIRELIALKETAAEDPVVDAAIASLNPATYQRGISTPSQLIDRFRRVAGEVRKASLLPEDAGVASHASSWLLSHILFRKQGLTTGDDVESILTRAQTYLEEGDLDSAAREMNGLQGWAKTLSKDWLSEMRKVLEVQQALDVIATEARLQSLRVD